jgi:hypothetical protein
MGGTIPMWKCPKCGLSNYYRQDNSPCLCGQKQPQNVPEPDRRRAPQERIRNDRRAPKVEEYLSVEACREIADKLYGRGMRRAYEISKDTIPVVSGGREDFYDALHKQVLGHSDAAHCGFHSLDFEELQDKVSSNFIEMLKAILLGKG